MLVINDAYKFYNDILLIYKILLKILNLAQMLIFVKEILHNSYKVFEYYMLQIYNYIK